MTDCERLSDRMPEVALGRAAWSAEDAAHLAGCADCRAEWDLLLAARQLESRAPSVDAEAIAAAVQRRLATERMAGRWSRWAWAAGAAAAAAAIAVARGPEPRQHEAQTVAIEAEPLLRLPELEGLETAQLDSLLQALDGPLPGSSTVDTTLIDGAADAELERLLATWEG